MNKLRNKKGFFPLWLGMQEAICGVKPKTNLDPDQQSQKGGDGDDDDQLPDLGSLISSPTIHSFILSF